MTNNDNLLFSMDRTLYTKLSPFNNNFHLYSEYLNNGGKKKKTRTKSAELPGFDSNTTNDLIILNRRKTIKSEVNIRDKIIKKNNKLRLKLNRELEKLHINIMNSYEDHNLEIESGLLWITLTTSCILYVIIKL
jgi:hypothetical protein